MKIPFNLKRALSNKVLLYVVFGIALLQWLYLLSINRFDLIIIFALMAFILYNLNKNMIFVLGIPLIIIWIKLRYRIEGFEGSSDSETEEKSTEEPEKPKSTSDSKKEKKPSSNKKSSDIVAPTPHNEDETKDAVENNEGNEGSKETSGDSADQDPEFDSNQVNYAATLTQNMKSYNDILGSDGFAKMSQDTQQLLIQQEQLGNAMKQFAPLIGQMTPFLEKASGLLNNMDMKQINNVANVFKNQ